MNKFNILAAFFALIWAIPAGWAVGEKKLGSKGSSPSSAKTAAAEAPAQGKDLWSVTVKTIDGQATSLKAYQGKVLLIVNTASQCGFTPQYAGLEKIYQNYKSKNFLVLGFPSNDFGGQEPGTEAEIKKFCELKYKTTFPMFAKVGVRENPHPLYQYLQQKAQAEVGWNFGKFLVKKDGSLQYFSSKVTPDSKELTAAIEAALRE